MAILPNLRRLRIFGQRDKLKTDRSKRGVRSGCKEETAQRGIQSAGGDGGAFRGEDPDGAVGEVWGSSDDGSRLLRACYGISAWVSTAWFAHDSPLEGAVRCELVSAAGSDSAPYEFLESIKKEGPQPSDALPPFSCNQN